MEASQSQHGSMEVLFEIRTSSLAGLFAQAARSLCNVLTRADDVMARESRVVELHAENLQGLLRKWLHELLVVYRTEGVLFSCARVELEETSSGQVALKGHLWGEPYDPERHPVERSPAGLESWALELDRQGELWQIRMLAHQAEV